MYLRLAAAAVIAIFLAGTHWKAYTVGKSVVQVAWDTEKAEMVLAAAEAQKKNQETADKVAEKVVTAAAKDRIVYRTILKEAANVPNDCPLPSSVRVLHDAAASAEMPDTRTSGTDAAPITAQSLTETIVENYEACQDSIRRLQALQEVVRSFNGGSP